jgi:sugar/nucleoside kinase (ribokinase family)
LFRDDFVGVTREYVDLLLCNEDEAKEITGESSARRAIEILKSYSEMVCVTTGSAGAVVAAGNEVTLTPSLAVREVVDTTGAGDMYAAGVLRGLTVGFDLVCASMIGSRMAAVIVGRVGARLP